MDPSGVLGYDPNTSQVVAETLVSIVTRSALYLADGSAQWVAVKTATTRRELTREPHDIVKELRILSTLSNPSIIDVIGSTVDPKTSMLRFWMPYITNNLITLLRYPQFSPRPFQAAMNAPFGVHTETFTMVAKSLIYQIISGISYLHHPSRAVAHRDIKPSNILVAEDGCVKIVDFGIAYKETDTKDDRKKDIWDEGSTHMYNEVATGPYRAPELLFGPRAYDALACDQWSLGATIAEFFTSVRHSSCDEDDDVDSGSEDMEDSRTRPYVPPKDPRVMSDDGWERCCLFDSERGDIGLIWSIFKTRGTANDGNWPTFKELPDATKLTFIDSPGIPLSTLLPNLPSAPPSTTATSHYPPDTPAPTPLDLIHRLLVYTPSSRIKASKAVDHPWFTSQPLLLPTSFTDHMYSTPPTAATTWKDQSLAQCLSSIIALPLPS